MMMGSLEKAIEGAQTKPEVEDVVNDLDIEEEEVDIENQEVIILNDLSLVVRALPLYNAL